MALVVKACVPTGSQLHGNWLHILTLFWLEPNPKEP